MKAYATHLIDRGGTRLALHVQVGEGPAVVFQHGLCGDARQPADVFPQGSPSRHAVLDCRGHGASAAGPLEDLSIETFTDDLEAAIMQAALGPCIVGGISMGAAIAMRLACRRPDLVTGLVIARPAWGCALAPDNMRPNLEVGEILSLPASTGERARFLSSPTGTRLEAEAPDNLASLAGFFDRAPREVTAALLTRISRDGPGVTEAQLKALAVPTLVIGHGEDYIHPLPLAQDLARRIPTARFVEIPSKARDKAGYVSAFRQALRTFIEDIDHAHARP